MKRLTFSLSLVLVILLSACAPAILGGGSNTASPTPAASTAWTQNTVLAQYGITLDPKRAIVEGTPMTACGTNNVEYTLVPGPDGTWSSIAPDGKTCSVAAATPTATVAPQSAVRCTGDYKGQPYDLAIGDSKAFADPDGTTTFMCTASKINITFAAFTPVPATATLVPTLVPTLVLTVAANTPVASNGVATMPVCAGDKISTIDEVGKAGPQRIEVSTGDIQHLDYYPAHSIKSVSILVHKDDPYTLLAGFGSIWQWALRDCGNYDFIADMTAYAKGRTNVGHSGLIYASLKDYLDGKDPVVNLWGADPKQYRPVFWDDATGAPSTTNTGGTVSTAICTASRFGDSDNMTSVSAPADKTYSVEAWGGKLGDSFVVIPAGQTITKNWQGGAIWSYSCTDTPSVVKDVSGHNKPVYVVTNGTLVKQ